MAALGYLGPIGKVCAGGGVAPKAGRCFGTHLYVGASLDDLILAGSRRLPMGLSQHLFCK